MHFAAFLVKFALSLAPLGICAHGMSDCKGLEGWKRLERVFRLEEGALVEQLTLCESFSPGQRFLWKRRHLVDPECFQKRAIGMQPLGSLATWLGGGKWDSSWSGKKDWSSGYDKSWPQLEDGGSEQYWTNPICQPLFSASNFDQRRTCSRTKDFLWKWQQPQRFQHPLCICHHMSL